MKLYIFRHGETFESKNNLLYGDNIEKAEILPEGIPTIKQLAQYLKNTKTEVNYSSPFLRCRQTVKIVSEITNKEFIYNEKIGEFMRKVETMEQFFDRITIFYNELLEKNYGSVSICSHGYPISAIIQLITTGEIKEEKLNPYPNTGVLTIINDSKEVDYLDFN